MMKTRLFILTLAAPALIVLIFLLLFNSPSKAAANLNPYKISVTILPHKEDEPKGEYFLLSSFKIVSDQYKSNRN